MPFLRISMVVSALTIAQGGDSAPWPDLGFLKRSGCHRHLSPHFATNALARPMSSATTLLYVL